MNREGVRGRKMILTKRKTNMKKEKGMSLLEVIVAMLFFAVITMSANIFLVGIIRANVSMKNTTQATQYGNQILDNIRAKTYDDIQDGQKIMDSKYNCQWEVNEASNMKKISLTVSWPTGNRDHKVKLSTIVAK